MGSRKPSLNAGKSAQFQSYKGRYGGRPSSNRGGRARNVKHSGGEEHSRVSKFSRGRK